MTRPLVQYQEDNRYSKTSHRLERRMSKSEVATPKLEPTVKEELDEQDADGQDADTLREELPNREEISQPDSEDSLGPEQVADELRRLTEAHAQTTGSTSVHDPRGGATAPDASWDTQGPYAPQRPRRNRGRALTPDPLMFRTTIWSMIRRQVHVHMRNL